ncbi:hypothetical protein AAMO2058_000751400 [Amorphochlora amoebiformis]
MADAARRTLLQQLLGLYFLLYLVPHASGEKLFSIRGALSVPRESKPSNMRVVINGGEHVAVPQANGRFIIHGLAPDTYHLQVQSVDYVFSPVRIDISAKDNGKIRAISADPMNKKERIPYPLNLKPKAQAQYFEKHKPFNPMGLLANPMFLMMGACLLLMGFSKFIDPEELNKAQKELQRQQLEERQRRAPGAK